MYQNSFYPLRTIVGDPIAINLVRTGTGTIAVELGPDISIVEESQASRDLDHTYEIKYNTLTETKSDSRYKNYFPVFELSGRTSVPGSGMDSLPLPAVRPFPNDVPVVSLFGLSNKLKSSDVSRQLSVKLQIGLANPALVGGICFGGFPFLPYELESNGQNSANFGLPREIRLISGESANAFSGFGKTDGFLDFENSVTRQEIVSHSGFHYLQIDPTLTDSLILHLSDYPTFLTKKITPDRSTGPVFPVSEERYGFVIPYFYVFSYQEKTRFKPIVSAGLLGARHEKNSGALDLEHTYEQNAQRNERHYFDFTAGSIFGQQRELSLPTAPSPTAPDHYDEAFITNPVTPEEKIILYIQQAEEYRRCIAGLKMYLPFVPDDVLPRGISREQLEAILRKNLNIPEKVNFCERIGIRVFELDPVEGVSPLLVPLDSKYATLLAEKTIDQSFEIPLASGAEGIKFVRPSTAKFFAIELKNLDAEAGQFVVKKLQLIQSAHVSIHPRASKTQQVSALHFRLIGPDLADDYALLGEQGFNFSIERLVAGERKSVLLRVNSLLDLLHTGAAKIFSNGRRRGVEQEISIMKGGETDNFESRNVEGGGWRSSETGAGVQKKSHWTDPSGNFEAVSSQENRTLNEILAPQHDVNSWISAALIGNVLNHVFQLGQVTADTVKSIFMAPNFENVFLDRFLGENPSLLIPTYTNVPLLEGFENVWKGLADSSNPNSLKVRGLTNVTASPWGINRVGKELLDILGDFSNLANLPALGGDVVDAGGALTQLLAPGPYFMLSVMNSMGASISGSPGGVGFSLSGSLLFPSFSHNYSFGTQGNKTLQATRNEYAFSQYKNASFDEVTTSIGEGKSRRIVTREEVEGEDHKRVKGAEVMWQGQLNDILTGSIPLNFTLPATASKEHYRTADNSLRVRFGCGIGKSISADFWFDILEEVIQDDY